MPAEDKKLVLEIMGEIVDWVNGQAKLGTRKGTTATAQNLVREWWSCGDDLRPRDRTDFNRKRHRPLQK